MSGPSQHPDPGHDGHATVQAIVEAFCGPRGRALSLVERAFREGTSLDQLAQSLAREPMLAARFVRLANASFWGPGTHSSGLARAVTQLGGGATPWIVLVTALASGLPEHSPCATFDAAGWHRRAWTRAVAALTVARTCGMGFGPEAFAAGFLPELGEFALAIARPDLHEELAAEDASPAPLTALSRAVRDSLCASWNLPARVVRALREIQDGAEQDSQDPALVETLAFADAAVRLFEGEDKGTALTRLEERAARAFELPPDMVYETVSLLDGFAREARAVFDGGPAPLAPVPRVETGSGAVVRTTTRGVRDAVVPPEIEHRRSLASDPSLQDPESGTPGRTAFERFLDREIQARLRGVVRRPLCVLVLSLEDYPWVHRERGPEGARAWLSEAAQALAKRVRRGDLFARLGGSYFGVCMSEADSTAMELLVERLRDAVVTEERAAEGKAASFAIGGASLSRASAADDGRDLLRSAVLLLKEALDERGGVRLSVGPLQPPHAA